MIATAASVVNACQTQTGVATGTIAALRGVGEFAEKRSRLQAFNDNRSGFSGHRSGEER